MNNPLLLVVLVCPAFLSAQNKSPDLSGYWELRFDIRNVPPASLIAPATAAERAARVKHDRDAIRWCHFFGVPYMMAWSPVEVVQNTNGKEIAITSPVRTPARHIYTDGRPHVSAETFDPTSTGNSIGHWEGDTLVVDTIGMNERTWLDAAGHPHGEKLHVTEKFTRPDSNTLRLEATIDDPDYYTKPWSVVTTSRWAPGQELMEYICQENNRDLQHLVGK